MSTRKQRNGTGNNNSGFGGSSIGGGNDYHDGYGNTDRYNEIEDRPYTDEEGYKTQDEEEEEEDLDASGRSGSVMGSSVGKGVRFGPGTKEASEAGTDLESEAEDDVSSFFDFVIVVVVRCCWVVLKCICVE
jgi:hypothetical protein